MSRAERPKSRRAVSGPFSTPRLPGPSPGERLWKAETRKHPTMTRHDAKLARSPAGEPVTPAPEPSTPIVGWWSLWGDAKEAYDAAEDGPLGSPEACAKTALHDHLCKVEEALFRTEVTSLSDLAIKGQLLSMSTWLRDAEAAEIGNQLFRDICALTRPGPLLALFPRRIPEGGKRGAGGSEEFVAFEALVARYHRCLAALEEGETDEDLDRADRDYRAATLALMTTPAPTPARVMAKYEILERELAIDDMHGQRAGRSHFVFLGCLKAELLSMIDEISRHPA